MASLPYSRWRQVGDTYYISGQLPLTADGTMAEGITAQTEAALANLERVAAEFGCTRADIVKTTVFLRDFDDFAAMNEVYAGFFADLYPARSAFAVSGLVPGAAIEIEAIATKQSNR